MKQLTPIFLFFFSLLFWACYPDDPIDLEPSGPENATAIQIWSGNHQAGIIGQDLDEPLVVQVVNEFGEGVRNVPVRFFVSHGGGSLTDTFTYTTTGGLATVIWTMGDSVSVGASCRVLAHMDIPGSNYLAFYASADAFGLPGSMTDNRDGESYATTQIGNQVWMAENLRYNSSGSYQNPQNPGYIYGRLYTWDQANSACPLGWHLPNNEEWRDMAFYLAEYENLDGYASWDFLGQDLKSTSGWNTANGNNLYNFNAYPAGYRSASGTSAHLGDRAYFWSASDTSATDAYFYRMNYYSSSLDRDFQGNKANMYSCRCVRD